MARLRRFRLPCDFPRENDREWTQMGYLLGQKQRKVGRLQRQAAPALARWAQTGFGLLERRHRRDQRVGDGLPG